MRIFYTLVFFVFSTTLFAQSTAGSIISPAGTEFTKNNFSIVWTLGEPIIKTIEADDLTVTQGFHQTYFVISSVNEVEQGLGVEVNVYPNPASTYFFVELSNLEEQQNFEFLLSDIHGKVIETGVFSDIRTKINLDQLANSTYFFTVFNPINQQKKNFKIQKVQ